MDNGSNYGKLEGFLLETNWYLLMVKFLDLMKATNWNYLMVKFLSLYLKMYTESQLGLMLEHTSVS